MSSATRHWIESRVNMAEEVVAVGAVEEARDVDANNTKNVSLKMKHATPLSQVAYTLVLGKMFSGSHQGRIASNIAILHDRRE